MVNAAQAKQGYLEFFLALAWPKQLSGTQKMIAFTSMNNVGENHNKPPNQGKNHSPQLTMK